MISPIWSLECYLIWTDIFNNHFYNSAFCVETNNWIWDESTVFFLNLVYISFLTSSSLFIFITLIMNQRNDFQKQIMEKYLRWVWQVYHPIPFALTFLVFSTWNSQSFKPKSKQFSFNKKSIYYSKYSTWQKEKKNGKKRVQTFFLHFAQFVIITICDKGKEKKNLYPCVPVKLI